MECDIRIKSPTYSISTDLIIKHNSDDTVFQLKTKIKHALANDSLIETSQKLIYAGHVLEDDRTLSQLNVPSSATFHLVTPPSIKPPAVTVTNIVTDDTSSTAQPADDSEHLSQSNGLADSGTSTVNSVPPMASATTEIPSPAAVPIPAEFLEQLEAERMQNSDSNLPNIQSVHTNVESLLERREGVERTDVSYELYYIDGYPYLVKAAPRISRSSRRTRGTGLPLSSSEFAFNQNSLASRHVAPIIAGGPTAGAVVARQHHVDLPATAAIPVRTADGRRALILSPEGVRAMAAQGVNVDVGRRDPPFGITSASFRQFMRTGVPHAWLILKLSFLVAMLGANSSWYRFAVLNLIAIGIFFWQSGILRTVFIGRPGASPAVNPPAPATPNSGTEQHQPGEQVNAVSGSSVPLSDGTGSSVQSRQQVRLLRNFGRAFLSSIVPSVTDVTHPRPPVPAHPEPQRAAEAPLLGQEATLGEQNTVIAPADQSADGQGDEHSAPDEHLSVNEEAETFIENERDVDDDALETILDHDDETPQELHRDW